MELQSIFAQDSWSAPKPLRRGAQFPASSNAKGTLRLSGFGDRMIDILVFKH